MLDKGEEKGKLWGWADEHEECKALFNKFNVQLHMFLKLLPVPYLTAASHSDFGVSAQHCFRYITSFTVTSNWK